MTIGSPITCCETVRPSWAYRTAECPYCSEIAVEVSRTDRHGELIGSWMTVNPPGALSEYTPLAPSISGWSEGYVVACAAADIAPLIATGRQEHHPSWRERFAAAPPAPENPTPVEAMAWQLRTPHGKALYALRKQTPEPVFGIIKSVMGFRQFLLRGLDRVRGEWSLVTMSWNIKRMHVLSSG